MAREEELADVRRRMSGPRWIWAERPTLLHDRATAAGQCPCGCESWSGEDDDDKAAILVETIPGPELLIDRWKGTRILRSDQSELDGTLAKFDALKRSPHVEHVTIPRRCYREQLVAIAAKPNVKGIFGGVRGGKSQGLAEEAVDEWFAVGGRGVRLWWVAPELGDTIRGVNKLILGEAIKGGMRGEMRPPLIPRSLVASFPGSRNSDPDSILEQVKRRKPIRLVDGTIIELRYAGRGGVAGDTAAASQKGGNLKGDAVAWIGVDEGAEIMSSSTWHTLIQRTTDSGGHLTTATTPKVGSPLKHMVKDEGVDLVANDGEYLTGYVHLSMLMNPWITARKARTTIETLRREPNGEDLIAQDIEGKWITPGHRMWEHFDEAAHVIDWHRRDLHGYKLDGRGLINITPQVAAEFFRGTTADLERVGGQDFNNRGNVTAVVQVWCPEDLDASLPDNWVIFVEDIVVKAGEPSEAARFLARQAGAMRNLKHDYFAGMAISCDASGAQDRHGASTTGNVHSMFTFADEYRRVGFDMRPCHRTENDKPANPEKPAQQAVLHRLMRRNDLGQLAPRYAAGERGLPPSVRLLIRKSGCPELTIGLREQQCNELGFLRKRGDTRDDRISDAPDALLYALWALFSGVEYYPKAKIHSW